MLAVPSVHSDAITKANMVKLVAEHKNINLTRVCEKFELVKMPPVWSSISTIGLRDGSLFVESKSAAQCGFAPATEIAVKRPQ